jgi:cyanophycinase
MSPKGVLIPIGGNEDKGQNESENFSDDFVEEGILSHVVREAGGQDANIVIIPTASSIPKEVGKSYLDAFGHLGCTNLKVLDIRNRMDSTKKENLKALEQADCLMFSGGDQSKIAKFIGGTDAHKLITNRYQNERFVIAGTSAGAMAMSENMVAGGSSQESLYKGAVIMRTGLNLIKGLVIDTHFIRGVVAYDVSCLMEYKGYSLQKACEEVIQNRLIKIGGDGGLIAIDTKGNTCLEFNTEGMYRGMKNNSGEESILIYK